MKSPTAKPGRNPWPHAIIIWFIIFGSALAAWVAFALRQNQDLVRADYYEEEIHFQQQLDRLNNTAAIQGAVTIDYNATKGEVSLRLPLEQVAQKPSGQVQFYRPSNASLDFQVPLTPDESGLQRISVGALRAGHWKVRIQWRVGTQDYFFEQTLVLT